GHAAPALLSQRKGDASGAALAAARRLVGTLTPGYDFTREIVLTAELGLGDTSLVDGDDGLAGFVLWHSTPLAEGRPKDEVRVLKLAARDERAFEASIAATEAAAARAGIRRVAVRCQTRFDATFRRLGAVAMVVCGVLSLPDAYAAIDLDVLVFLLGVMLIVGYLEVGKFFEWAAEWVLRRARTPERLLLGVVVGGGLLSALFVNDTVCL